MFKAKASWGTKLILIYIPFTTYEKNSFTELAGRSFTNGFSGPKCFRDFRETGPEQALCGGKRLQETYVPSTSPPVWKVIRLWLNLPIEVSSEALFYLTLY